METLTNNPYLLVFAMLTLLSIILGIVSFWQLRIYRRKQEALLSGGEISNLEELVLKHKKLLATHNKTLSELGKILEELIEQNKYNIQQIGMVRFNPFNDTGGNMSFAIALLDGYGSGIVISSLHNREGTRIYTKSIENGRSQYRLTDEENQALQKAHKTSPWSAAQAYK